MSKPQRGHAERDERAGVVTTHIIDACRLHVGDLPVDHGREHVTKRQAGRVPVRRGGIVHHGDKGAPHAGGPRSDHFERLSGGQARTPQQQGDRH
jgi:hypothetical protein